MYIRTSVNYGAMMRNAAETVAASRTLECAEPIRSDGAATGTKRASHGADEIAVVDLARIRAGAVIAGMARAHRTPRSLRRRPSSRRMTGSRTIVATATSGMTKAVSDRGRSRRIGRFVVVPVPHPEASLDRHIRAATRIFVRRAAYSPRSCRTTPIRGRFLTSTAIRAMQSALRARAATFGRAISIPLSISRFSSSSVPCLFAVAKARSPEVFGSPGFAGIRDRLRCLGQVSSGERAHDSRLGIQQIAGPEALPVRGRLLNEDIHHVSRKKTSCHVDDPMLPCNKKSVNPSCAIIAEIQQEHSR
jgi:hypothetical protein